MTQYDSKADTLEHIRKVSEYLGVFAIELIKRGMAHDDSKLGPIEKPHFDRETPMLKELTYGSPEYKESLGRLQDALKHHYAANSHHPEFHKEGVNGMSLLDVVEMFCDWKAASERNKGGKLNLEISFERFKFSKQLADIFRNTARALNYEVVGSDLYNNPLFEKGSISTVSNPPEKPYVKIAFEDLETAHKFVDWVIANK